MNRQLIVTSDGSHTFFVPIINEQYHSIHGAVTESIHIFINSGLLQCKKREINVLEIGFGTGLNAYLTLLSVLDNGFKVNYYSVEKYPLTQVEYEQLNYAAKIKSGNESFFIELHECKWGENVKITPDFSLFKIHTDARNLELEEYPFFDVIYFDAFAPDKHPDLWNEDIYNKIYNHSNPNAIFVTYCAKGVVRRSLQQVGFKVERIPGPPGKKEMIRAIK